MKNKNMKLNTGFKKNQKVVPILKKRERVPSKIKYVYGQLFLEI